MSRRQFDPEFPQQLLGRFLAEPRQPGDPFWTTRDIMRRFGVSLYAANAAVRELVREGVLERQHRVGTFLAKTRAGSRKATPTAAIHLGVILPFWVAIPDRNPWATELWTMIEGECRRRGWRLSLFQEPGQGSDPLFPTRFSTAGGNRLLILGPSGESVPMLTKLREAGVPMASIGRGPPAFDLLKIPVVDGNDEEAMRRLVLQLRREGYRRLLVVGFTNSSLGADRVRGCVEAFEQFAHEYPTDAFVESPDPDYLAATVTKRLVGRVPVEAIIFQNHLAFLMVLERVAVLKEKILAGLPVAVIDEYYLRRRFPDLPLIEAAMNPRTLARTALDVLDACACGERTRKLTLLPYEIVWPAGRKSTSSKLKSAR